MQSDPNLKKYYEIKIDEDGFLWLKFLKYTPGLEDNNRTAELVYDDFQKFYRERPGKYKVVIDLQPLGKIGAKVPIHARMIYLKTLTAHEFIKCAVIGRASQLELLTSFISKATGVSQKIKWFENFNEAIKWLNE